MLANILRTDRHMHRLVQIVTAMRHSVEQLEAELGREFERTLWHQSYARHQA